jgi:hypothetical protein
MPCQLIGSRSFYLTSYHIESDNFYFSGRREATVTIFFLSINAEVLAGR